MSLVKSKQRVADHGEAFTPEWMVEAIQSLNFFNSGQMNQAVFAFRRYVEASLSYADIDSHENLSHVGLYNTVVARDAFESAS